MVSGSKNILSFGISLLLLLLFTVFVVATVLFGARVFRGIRQDMESSYYERTASAYISAKLRHADVSGAVYSTELDGVPAICVRETDGGESYLTFIYSWDGYLMELFCPDGVSLSGSAGEKVVPLDSFCVEITDGTVSYSCEYEGRMYDSCVTLRSR